MKKSLVFFPKICFKKKIYILIGMKLHTFFLKHRCRGFLADAVVKVNEKKNRIEFLINGFGNGSNRWSGRENRIWITYLTFAEDWIYLFCILWSVFVIVSALFLNRFPYLPCLFFFRKFFIVENRSGLILNPGRKWRHPKKLVPSNPRLVSNRQKESRDRIAFIQQ